MKEDKHRRPGGGAPVSRFTGVAAADSRSGGAIRRVMRPKRGMGN